MAEGGLVAQYNPYLDLEGSASSADGKFGISAGATLRPRELWSDWVTIQRTFSAGIVPEWRPDTDTSVKLFAGGTYDIFPGDFGFVATTGDAMVNEKRGRVLNVLLRKVDARELEHEQIHQREGEGDES